VKALRHQSRHQQRHDEGMKRWLAELYSHHENTQALKTAATKANRRLARERQHCIHCALADAHRSAARQRPERTSICTCAFASRAYAAEGSNDSRVHAAGTGLAGTSPSACPIRDSRGTKHKIRIKIRPTSSTAVQDTTTSTGTGPTPSKPAHRQYTDRQKLAIVAEGVEPGMSVSEVTRPPRDRYHGVPTEEQRTVRPT
jgi:hypothetical protein